MVEEACWGLNGKSWLHPFVIDGLDAVYRVFSHLCLQTRGRASWRGGEVAARIRGNKRFTQGPERPSTVSYIHPTLPKILQSSASNVIPPTLETKAPARRSQSLPRLVPPEAKNEIITLRFIVLVHGKFQLAIQHFIDSIIIRRRCCAVCRMCFDNLDPCPDGGKIWVKLQTSPESVQGIGLLTVARFILT